MVVGRVDKNYNDITTCNDNDCNNAIMTCTARHIWPSMLVRYYHLHFVVTRWGEPDGIEASGPHLPSVLGRLTHKNPSPI